MIFTEIVKDFLYRKFISKGLLELKKESYEKGYRNGKEEFEEEIEWKVNQKYVDQTWVINPDNVLTVAESTGIIYLNGEQISALEIKELKAEVKTLKSFKIWNIFQETIRQKAIEKAVINADATVLRDINPELLSGKMMIHNLGIMRSILNVVDNYKM